VAGQIVLAAAELVRGGGFSSLMVDAIGGDPSIRILGKAIQLQGSLGAGGGGSIFVGGKGTSPSAQLVDTVTAIVSADVWGDDSFTTAKYKVWASEELEASGLLYLQTGSGSEVEFVSGNRLKFTARVVASADAASPGTLLLQAKDVLVAFENEPWSLDVMKVNSALTYAKVTVKADRNLTVAGYPSALFLMGFVYWVRPASLSLIAGNDLQLQNAIVGKIGDFSLQAGNDIHISNFSATTNLGGGCRISAGRNVYISDSIFSNWCYATIPSQIQTGGQLFLNNVVFYQ
jgi:hypothetical protein